MSWLAWIHVLAAIVGVGPVFFYPVLFRKQQTANELMTSLLLSAKLDLFPKIGGTLAAVSGLALSVTGNYGPFMQLWLVGSLLLYIAIQVIVIGMIAPRVKQLQAALKEPESSIVQKVHSEIRSLFLIACSIGFVLFVLMVVKPSL